MTHSIFKKIVTYVLQTESRLVLWKYKPKVITITGSVGKTSTKDAIYAVISGVSYVRKSEKSYNSEIGLPLTILGCANAWNNPYKWFLNILKGIWLFIWPHQYPQWLVLEVGVGKPGDMFTSIGDTPSHIEFFDSHKHLVEEKSGLIKTLKKDGLLILNNDDEIVSEMKTRIKNRVITFGFKEDSDIKGSGDSIFYTDEGEPGGLIFRIDETGNSFPVVIEGVFGKNHVYASLGALAFSSGLKFNMLQSINKLKNYNIPPGRMRLLKGINNSFIIDDTYNSSPFACESALKTLGEIKSNGRKIAVLGDMLELGHHTEEAHKNIGKIAKENVDVLMTVGPRAEKIKEGTIEAGMNIENIFEFLNSQEAGEFLKTFVQKNDFVLIKGSQGMRMERAVEAILEDKKNKSQLLVRQDEEWLKKK
ncbi:MAG: UDP-N-acetylmuramoyl-tripeptide-D-alanyl-D-alanine ligase [Parcubacteria group bacterium GW2011_GWC1_35_21]|nr:MAG: UDP-N-acetylmuramoyl-tripeptide-D-alanyl-D-alanine ligase [Parcubacteria group bacterium GW2011_GWC1_35_21]